jgi:hypothetical protein
MLPPGAERSFLTMRRWFYILLIAIALIVLALLGWTMQGIRAVAGSRRPSLAPAVG